MRFGFPRDPAQLVALVLGLLAIVGAATLVRPGKRDRVFLGTCMFVATALSAAYVVFYLRGGPRIIDATSYFLEARAMAQGHLAFRLEEPVASTIGRFLVRVDDPEGPHAAVIFPPGYPAVLALGFLLGQPMIVGPLLAAALTAVTWALAREIAPTNSSLVSIPRLAAVLSVACAALRYHTADTMSHGLSAVCFTSALWFALQAIRTMDAGRSGAWPALAAGLFAGWLAATRPVSAMALGVVLAVVFASRARSRLRTTASLVAVAVLGAVPGLVLLAAHQHAATGELFASSQSAYYAVSDGPTGCFRYGFGAGIGCLGEHGEFVQKNLSNGYGAYAAAATTLRRLKQHLVDAGNIEPFFLVVLAGAVMAFRDSRLRVLPLAVLVQMAAYVPFYFDGNYPGGGARFYADVLPLEHVLAAIAIVGLAERARDPKRVVSLLIALVPLGFAFRGGFEHAALRDREGGRPMFEPSRLPDVEGSALLYVDTDHGFNLAFDPDKHVLTSNHSGWTIARFRGDSLDLWVWLSRGKSPAYRYVFPLGTDHPDVQVVPYVPDQAAPLVIEGESLWPPIAQQDGYVLGEWPDADCASARRWLVVKPVDPDKPASVTFSLPAPFLDGRFIAPRLGLQGAVSGTVSYFFDGRLVHQERVQPSSDSENSAVARCLRLPKIAVNEGVSAISIKVERDPGLIKRSIALDRIDIQNP